MPRQCHTLWTTCISFRADSFSALLVVLVIVGFAVRGLTFGIEFKGGTEIDFHGTGSITIEQMRSAFVSAGEADPTVALALLPYVLVVVIIAVTKLWRIGVSLPDLLKSTDLDIPWPGLYGHFLTQ